MTVEIFQGSDQSRLGGNYMIVLEMVKEVLEVKKDVPVGMGRFWQVH